MSNKKYNELTDEEVAALRNRNSVPSAVSTPIQEQYQDSIDDINVSPVVEEKITRKFDTFIDIPGLPSKSLFYNNTLQGQALKVDDIILLSGITASNQFSRFTDVFTRRIMGAGALDILEADQVYLAMWLRYTAYPNIPFPGREYQCNHCKTNVGMEDSQYYFEQMTYEIEDIDDIYDEYNSHGGFIPVELTDRTVKILPLRRSHQQRISMFIKKFYGTEERISTTDKLKLELLSNVDVGLPLREAIDWLSNISPEDFMKLVNNREKYSIKAQLPKINATCVSCGEDTPIPGYVFRGSLYIPKEQY